MKDYPSLCINEVVEMHQVDFTTVNKTTTTTTTRPPQSQCCPIYWNEHEVNPFNYILFILDDQWCNKEST